jgi:hypothetical protein
LGRKRPASAVLEAVDYFSERPVVDAGAQRDSESRWKPSTAGAQAAMRGPLGEHVAAPDATRRTDLDDRPPAGVTDRTLQRPLQRSPAPGTRGREQKVNQRIDNEAQTRGHPGRMCKGAATSAHGQRGRAASGLTRRLIGWSRAITPRPRRVWRRPRGARGRRTLGSQA